MKQLSIYLAIFLLAGVWVSRLSAQEPEPVNLKIKLEEKEAFKIIRESFIETRVSMMTTVMTLTTWSDAQVLEKRQGKEFMIYKLGETVTRAKVDGHGTFGEESFEITFDSADENPAEPQETETVSQGQTGERLARQMEAQFKNMVDQKIQYEVSETGKTISWAERVQANLQDILTEMNVFAGMPAPFPEAAAVGTTWQKKFEPAMLKAMMQQLDASSFTCNCISTLKEVQPSVDKSLAIIESRLDFKKGPEAPKKDLSEDEEAEISELLGEEKEPEQPGMGLEMKIKSIEGSGRMVFDLSRGRPVEHTDRVKLELDVGQEYIINQATTTRIE